MLLRYTNANGTEFDFTTDDVVIQQIDGADAAGVNTTMIQRAFREGSAYLRRRTPPRYITVSFNLVGVTQSYWAARREASEGLSPGVGLGTLEFQPEDADQIYEIDCSVSQLSIPYTNDSFAQGCAVEFEAPFPFWRGTTLQSESLISNGTIVVSGQLPVYPTVYIARNNAVSFSTPRWRNLTNGGDMNATGIASFITSQHLVADHFNSTLQRAASPLNHLNDLTIESNFWRLDVGSNSLQCTKGGVGTVAFEFEWYDLYSGV